MGQEEEVAELQRLRALLDSYESGEGAHHEDGEGGLVEGDLTPEAIERMKARIGDLTRRIDESRDA
jgi:hypothetical protein